VGDPARRCQRRALLSVIVARADVSALIRVARHVDPEEERINLTLLVTGLYLLGLAFNQLLPTIIGGDVAKAVYAGRLSGRVVGALAATLIQLLLFGFVGAVVLLTLTTAKPVRRFISWSAVEGRSHRAD
jgi:hypothetical protein